MPIPDDTTIAAETIAELRAKHGDLWHRRLGPHEFLLRCPEALAFRRYSIATSSEGKPTWDEQEVLAKNAVVYPPPDKLDALLGRRGMLIPWLANEIARIAAGFEDEAAKKA